MSKIEDKKLIAARVANKINGVLVVKVYGRNRYGNWRECFIDVDDVAFKSLNPKRFGTLWIKKDQGGVWDEITVAGAIVTIEDDTYMISKTRDHNEDELVISLQHCPTAGVANSMKP